MRSLLTLLRCVRVLLPAVGALSLLVFGVAACGKTAGRSTAPSSSPSISSVLAGRFVATVELDRGNLIVEPPPDGSRAHISEATARTMFESSDATEGDHDFAVLGLALATLKLSGPATPGTPGENVPASTPPASTAPTSSAPTSGGAPTSSPPTFAPGHPPTTPTAASPPAAPPLPAYEHRLAWVGIAWGGLQACPGTAAPGTKPTSNTIEVAMLIDAATGHDVIAYTNGGAASCNGQLGAPMLVRPNQLVSVPWQPVNPASTAVKVTVPPCGNYVGWTQVTGFAAQPAVQVVASVPFDPLCAARGTQVVSADDVIPLGPAGQAVPHAALGPLDSLRVLPS